MNTERIIRALEGGEEDYLLVPDMLGVNRSTAKVIVVCYIREGRIQERPRGGRNNLRMDEIALSKPSMKSVYSHLLR